MSLLNYFDQKPKKGSKKSGVGSKRKLSNDETTTDETKDPELDEPEKKRQRLSKSSNNNNSNNNSNDNSDNSKEKYVSDEDEEEEDCDIDENDKIAAKNKSKTKTTKSKSKSKTKTKSKSAEEESDSDEKEESTDITDDWDTIRSKIDISKLTYAECDELLHPSWKQQLKNEFNKPYYKTLRKKLTTEEKSGAEIFPPVSQVFRAFELCPWDDLKVVLLGQDPYHDNGQAEGLCFSVPQGIKVPSSLKNMYKEALSDIGMKSPNHGSLVEWGKQGVLLLNTVLTVRAHKANSHAKYGWQDFTDAVIKKISHSHDGVVFILWGKQAQKKKVLIDKTKHRIVESAHPSGLSASRGFYGSKPYSKTNGLLEKLGKDPIDWTITPR